MNVLACPTINRALARSAFALLLTLPTRGVPAAAATASAGTRFTIDASVAPAALETSYLQMGSGAAGKSPSGHLLAINSRYLTLDGKPWLPVMGEFHFSRFPAQLWEDEIMKMKAGGIQIIATYVFWIHHEEVEGQFDWSGRRDLRRFIELCAKHGMYVWARIGPWAHGEVRNGGLPDWLLAKGPTRVNDPVYFSYVRQYYDEVGRQLRGLLWKDGGPIIGVQLENEYTNRAPNGGAAHITALKQMAVAAGFDVPVYSVTGWDNAVYPPRSVTPVFGGYPDEPWSGSREELPPDTQGVYQYAPVGGNAGILQGVTAPSEPVQFWHYPRFTVELGAGMQLTYHRRVQVSADDIPPIAITALGSGVTLLGYYMYHGGTNPDGKLSTLEESQVTNYPNDLPVKSYDFQAPLREFGQVNQSYRKLKVIHQFLADFGAELAPMTRTLPDVVPTGMQDTTTLRVAARTDGTHGFLFFNNYVRHYPMPEQKGVQITLKLPSATLTVPHDPVNVPSQSSFYWPVNLDLDGAVLTYATAQPFATLGDGDTTYYFFVPSAGIAPEFEFDEASVASLQAPGGQAARRDGQILVTGAQPSAAPVIDLRTHTGRNVRLVLFSTEQAENAWKVALGGRERMLLTPADVFDDQGKIHLRSREASAFTLEIFPDVARPLSTSAPTTKTGADGLFARYQATVAPKQVAVGLVKVREAGSVQAVRMGPPFDWRHGSVAMAPDDTAFAQAAAWKLAVPANALAGVNDLFIDIQYVGDIGRLYDGEHLLDDNFYNGTPWEIGVKELAPQIMAGSVRLEVLPLRKDAPIYMPKGAWPDFGAKSQIAELNSVQAIPEYEVTVAAEPTADSTSP